MPEPLCVGRVTSMVPTLFFCLNPYCVKAGFWESSLHFDSAMKQNERAGIMRIVSDIVKADSIIDLREIDYLNEIKDKYRITKDDEVMGDSMTLSDAICLLRNLSPNLIHDIVGDFYNLALSDNVFNREEGLIILAITACLSENISHMLKYILLFYLIMP